jgi:hypothetical protein
VTGLVVVETLTEVTVLVFKLEISEDIETMHPNSKYADWRSGFGHAACWRLD